MAIAGLPRILTWEGFQPAVAEAFAYASEPQMEWLERVWERVVAEGQASCASVPDYADIVTRFLALVAFYDSYLQEFERQHFETDFRKLAGNLGAPEGLMNRLGRERVLFAMDPAPAEVLADQIREFIIPLLLREFGTQEWLATNLYLTSGAWWDDDPEYLQDFEHQEPENYTERKGYQEVLKWVREVTPWLTHSSNLSPDT